MNKTMHKRAEHSKSFLSQKLRGNRNLLQEATALLIAVVIVISIFYISSFSGFAAKPGIEVVGENLLPSNHEETSQENSSGVKIVPLRSPLIGVMKVFIKNIG